MTLALAVPLGLLIGAVMGALGGGGAILAVPVFVYLLHQEPHTAAASALVVVGVGAAAGALSQSRDGQVRWAQAVTFGALGVVGNLAGVGLARLIDARTLMVSFALLLVVVAAAMAQRLHKGRSDGGGAVPVPELLASPRRAVLLILTATATGALTGFFGVGGGFMIVPALVLVLGFGVREAVGSSLVVIALNSVVAFVPRLWQGLPLDWPLIATLTAASCLGTVAGAHLGRRVSASRLSQAFIVLLLMIAAYTLVRSG